MFFNEKVQQGYTPALVYFPEFSNTAEHFLQLRAVIHKIFLMCFRDFYARPKEAEDSIPGYMVILLEFYFLLYCFRCRIFIYRYIYLESFYKLIHVFTGCRLPA